MAAQRMKVTRDASHLGELLSMSVKDTNPKAGKIEHRSPRSASPSPHVFAQFLSNDVNWGSALSPVLPPRPPQPPHRVHSPREPRTAFDDIADYDSDSSMVTRTTHATHSTYNSKASHNSSGVASLPAARSAAEHATSIPSPPKIKRAKSGGNEIVKPAEVSLEALATMNVRGVLSGAEKALLKKVKGRTDPGNLHMRRSLAVAATGAAAYLVPLQSPLTAFVNDDAATLDDAGDDNVSVLSGTTHSTYDSSISTASSSRPSHHANSSVDNASHTTADFRIRENSSKALRTQLSKRSEERLRSVNDVLRPKQQLNLEQQQRLTQARSILFGDDQECGIPSQLIATDDEAEGGDDGDDGGGGNDAEIAGMMKKLSREMDTTRSNKSKEGNSGSTAASTNGH